MVIDFKEVKRENDIINNFFDFLEEIKAKASATCRDSFYYAQYGNLVKVYSHPKTTMNMYKKCVSHILLCTTDPYSQECISVCACLEDNRVFSYLYVSTGKEDYTIMKNAQGEIAQIETWYCYPPSTCFPVSKEVEKIVERIFNSCFTALLPTLETLKIPEEILNAMANGIQKIEKESKFTVIETENYQKKCKRLKPIKE